MPAVSAMVAPQISKLEDDLAAPRVGRLELARPPTRGPAALGLCLGMQIATIEFARNVLKLPKAHSTEFDPNTPNPVIAMLDD